MVNITRGMREVIEYKMMQGRKVLAAGAVSVIAATFIGVAQIDKIGPFVKESWTATFHEQNALERLQGGEYKTLHAKNAQSAVANAFEHRFNDVAEASGEFFLIGSDGSVYAVACDDAPSNGGYDDESVVMRAISKDYNPELYQAALEILNDTQGNDGVFVLVADNIGSVDLANTLAGQGGDFAPVQDVLVSGDNQPGTLYTGFRLYQNYEPVEESKSASINTPNGP